jgi:hypothetical protein
MAVKYTKWPINIPTASIPRPSKNIPNLIWKYNIWQPSAGCQRFGCHFKSYADWCRSGRKKLHYKQCRFFLSISFVWHHMHTCTYLFWFSFFVADIGRWRLDVPSFTKASCPALKTIIYGKSTKTMYVHR